MIVNIELEINTETKEVKLIGAEDQSVKIKTKISSPKKESAPKVKKATKSKAKNTSADEYDFPCIVLEESRMALNDAALEVLGVDDGDRVHIKYNKKEGVVTPVIARNDVFGVKAGNKLNKNKTVSWRGKNNETLAEHGEIFRLEETADDGIYEMVDINAAPAEKNSKGFKLTVDKNIKNLDETTEYDLEAPSNISGDSNSFEVSNDEVDTLLTALSEDTDADELDDIIDSLALSDAFN